MGPPKPDAVADARTRGSQPQTLPTDTPLSIRRSSAVNRLRGHSGARAQPASPEPMNTDERGLGEKPVSMGSAPGPYGPSRNRQSCRNDAVFSLHFQGKG